MRQVLVSLVLLTAPMISQAQGVISTIAGNGTQASSGDGGPATSASLQPIGLAVDKAGNVYIADLATSVIRKVNAAGVISTVAGYVGEPMDGDDINDGGPATKAGIYLSSEHNGLAVDSAGNLYIADEGHNRIRKVDVSTGIITTFAGNGTPGYSGDGGPATSAQLLQPLGVAFDKAGNLYIADSYSVRKVDTSGKITTVAGGTLTATPGDGGPATSAGVIPRAVAIDAAGNIFISDYLTQSVREVNTQGIINGFAGVSGGSGFSGDGGPATSALFGGLYGVAVDSVENVYICDFGNYRLREVNAAGIITTAAGGGSSLTLGDGGPPTSAYLQPDDVAVDSAGNYYIADYINNRVRKVTVGEKAPALLSAASSLYFSLGVAVNSSPNPETIDVYTLGTVPLLFTVTSSTSSGGNWLTTIQTSGTTPALITASILMIPGVGTFQGSIVLTPNAPDLSPITIPVTLYVPATAPPEPVITGVVNGASFQPGVVANSWATIQGTNLASTTDNWNSSIKNGQLPDSLDGVTVLFDGMPAAVNYISPTQINVLVPNVTSSTTQVVVTNAGSIGAGISAPASQYGPAFFS
jgi:sugar lactone lactonase YvrE